MSMYLGVVCAALFELTHATQDSVVNIGGRVIAHWHGDLGDRGRRAGTGRDAWMDGWLE
jgi:hypothetical protein